MAMLRQRQSSVLELQTAPVVVSDRAVKSVSPRATEEAIRWTTRLISLHPAPAKALLFLSLDEDEGAEGAARQTALALSQMLLPTLLVDANSASPWLHESFDISAESGLADVLSSGGTFPDAVHVLASNPNLSLLPAGRISGGKLLASAQGFTAFLKQARSRYDYTLINSAPYTKAPEVSLLAREADAVLLVVKARKHTRSQLLSLKREFETVKANLAGVLLCE